MSTDESLFAVSNATTAQNNGRDVIPVYVPTGRQAPIVYFSASTYRVDSYTVPLVFNTYETNRGLARPYKTDNINNKIDVTNWGALSLAQKDRYYLYANDKSFQIISAGLDDDFGGAALFFRFPSGTPLDVTLPPSGQPAGGNYQLQSGGGLLTQLDNVTNFSDGKLSSTLP